MRFLAELKEKRFIIFLNNKLNKYLLLKLYLTAETTNRIIDLKRINFWILYSIKVTKMYDVGK